MIHLSKHGCVSDARENVMVVILALPRSITSPTFHKKLLKESGYRGSICLPPCNGQDALLETIKARGFLRRLALHRNEVDNSAKA
jgi:hypothetical protein